MPAPGQSRTLVSVSAPAGVSIEGIPAGFETVTIARLDQARADWLDRSIRELLAKLDRSSGRDHERLVALLINHELALRAAERAAGRDHAPTPRGRPGQRDPIGSIASVRAGIDEAVRAAGLTDDLAAARGYLGLSQDAGNRPPGRHPRADRPLPHPRLRPAVGDDRRGQGSR